MKCSSKEKVIEAAEAWFAKQNKIFSFKDLVALQVLYSDVLIDTNFSKQQRVSIDCGDISMQNENMQYFTA